MGVDVRQRQFPCRQCGATLAFDPGVGSLKCAHCGTINDIDGAGAVEEIDYHAALAALAEAQSVDQTLTVQCDACGAEFTFEQNIHSDLCPFCGTAVVAAPVGGKRLRPKALIPFRIVEAAAQEAARKWLAEVWFAPNDLARTAQHDGALRGLFLPYWTFDSRTRSDYVGKRGQSRYVRRNGKTQTVIDWYPASGTVARDFDDVLICGSKSLPEQFERWLEPWDLKALVPYDPSYLAGFRSETYQVDLDRAFSFARARMRDVINGDIRVDIGGDRQEITSVDTKHDGVTFKHVLLPVWLAAYRYRGKPYRFAVNAVTGEVTGDYPLSWIKVGFALGVAATILGTITWFLYDAGLLDDVLFVALELLNQ